MVKTFLSKHFPSRSVIPITTANLQYSSRQMCGVICTDEGQKQAFMNIAINIPFRQKHKICSSTEQLVKNIHKL